jgi:hypothetical protein
MPCSSSRLSSSNSRSSKMQLLGSIAGRVRRARRRARHLWQQQQATTGALSSSLKQQQQQRKQQVGQEVGVAQQQSPLMQL